MAIALLFAPAAYAQRQQAEPETATGIAAKGLATATRHMISAANPYAAEAGLEMLRAGGSAADAAIAAQLVLGLVEPQSSGLGGGAFILNWDQPSKTLTSYDGRETAPASAKPDRFLQDGKPIAFDTAVKSGLSIGTPGTVRLLEAAHGKHGKLPWAKLFEPAIRLAESGFEVSSRLNLLLIWNGANSFTTDAKRYFFDELGIPRASGYELKNPEYAATLRAIANGGARAFYTGPIAEAIVAAARAAPNFAGDLSLDDLANYTVRERKPFCASYRSRNICGMGPPSSGGVAVAQILALLDKFDLGKGEADVMNPAAMHLIAESEKLAYADRDRYLADPDFVDVPGAGLLDPTYIEARRSLIDPTRAMPKPAAGEPPKIQKRAFGIDATHESVGTSHISVIDDDGNAVSMTTTIEGAFGSGVWAAGFLLNNEMTDFSFLAGDAEGKPIANRVEALKRPRSTMAPTIVFDGKGDVEAVLGSPGGSRIIYYVVKTLIALIDWNQDAQTATALTNFGSQGGALDVELAWKSLAMSFRMQQYGHSIRPDLLNSGTHVVARRNGRLEGGADPRREGAALGD